MFGGSTPQLVFCIGGSTPQFIMCLGGRPPNSFFALGGRPPNSFFAFGGSTPQLVFALGTRPLNSCFHRGGGPPPRCSSGASPPISLYHGGRPPHTYIVCGLCPPDYCDQWRAHHVIHFILWGLGCHEFRGLTPHLLYFLGPLPPIDATPDEYTLSCTSFDVALVTILDCLWESFVTSKRSHHDCVHCWLTCPWLNLCFFM